MTAEIFAGYCVLVALIAVVCGLYQRSALKHERAEKEAQRASARRAWDENHWLTLKLLDATAPKKRSKKPLPKSRKNP